MERCLVIIRNHFFIKANFRLFESRYFSWLSCNKIERVYWLRVDCSFHNNCVLKSCKLFFKRSMVKIFFLSTYRSKKRRFYDIALKSLKGQYRYFVTRSKLIFCIWLAGVVNAWTFNIFFLFILWTKKSTLIIAPFTFIYTCIYLFCSHSMELRLRWHLVKGKFMIILILNNDDGDLGVLIVRVGSMRLA